MTGRGHLKRTTNAPKRIFRLGLASAVTSGIGTYAYWSSLLLAPLFIAAIVRARRLYRAIPAEPGAQARTGVGLCWAALLMPIASLGTFLAYHRIRGPRTLLLGTTPFQPEVHIPPIIVLVGCMVAAGLVRGGIRPAPNASDGSE